MFGKKMKDKLYYQAYILFQLFLIFFVSYFYRITNWFIYGFFVINFAFFIYVVLSDRLKKGEWLTFGIIFSLILFHRLNGDTFQSVEIAILLSLICGVCIFYRLFTTGYSEFFIQMLAIFSLIIATYGAFEYLLEKNLIYAPLFGKYAYNTSIYPLRLSFGEPLISAFVFAMAFSYLAGYDSKKKNKIVLGEMFFSIVICLLSGKKSAFVLVGCLTLSYAILWMFSDHRYKKIKRIYLLLSGGLLVAVFLFFFLVGIDGQSLFHRIQAVFNPNTEEYMSFFHRASAIEKSLNHFFSNGVWKMLFGEGYRSLYLYFQSNAISITVNNFYVVDNTYISALNDFGLIPLFLFCAYSAVLFYRNMAALIKNYMAGLNWKKNYSAVAAMFICLTYMMFFDFLSWFPAIAFVFVTFGYCRYCTEINGEKNEKSYLESIKSLCENFSKGKNI